MAQKYPFSMWVYNPLSDFPPEELEKWVECGMSHPMAPKTYYGKDDPRILIPYLDKAEELGMKLIINYEDFAYQCIDQVGDEEYERRFREVYEPLKGHPALYGFYAGDEPNRRISFDQTKRCFAIQKKVAPELKPFINLIGGMSHKKENELLDLDLGEWFKLMKEVGCDYVSQDAYGCMINHGMNDNCITEHLHEVKDIVEAGEAAGVDVWCNMLSSGHNVFDPPTEAQMFWQINVAAAQGCRGGIWFRFYDREIGHDYFGSPIDEFGDLTEAYYGMKRSQRRFNNHYGELLMSLKRKRTFMTGYIDRRDLYPKLTDDAHDLVKIDGYEDGIISFFEDEEGVEYICIVNFSMKYMASWSLTFDTSKCRVDEVIFNGKSKGNFDGDYGRVKDGICKAELPYRVGEMRMFRIIRK